MKLLVERLQKDSDVTIGALSVDGTFECWTCEDAVREVPGQPVAQWKIHGKTAIPVGTYKVIVNMSDRFKVLMPLLLNVPGFGGIRIHSGNTAENTEGCLLPGNIRMRKGVGDSRKAYDKLFSRIRYALARDEEVTIEIV